MQPNHTEIIRLLADAQAYHRDLALKLVTAGMRLSDLGRVGEASGCLEHVLHNLGEGLEERALLSAEPSERGVLLHSPADRERFFSTLERFRTESWQHQAEILT